MDQYNNEDKSNPDALLKDMSSVMKSSKQPLKEEIDSINGRMMKHATALDNVLRENKTLRTRNTNLSNSLRQHQQHIYAIENDVEFLKKVLLEQSKRIDELENNAIIKNKR